MSYDGAKVIEIATKEIGTTEGPNNDNKYGTAFGLNHEPWCSEFVWYVMDKAGFGSLYPKTAITRVSYPYYKQKGWLVPLADVRPGDILWFYFPGGLGPVDHVGFVARNLGNGVVGTIEGNTSKASGSPTDGVWRRQRSSNIVAAGRPGGHAGTSGAAAAVPYPGTVTKHGSTGSAVEYVQRNLNRFLAKDIAVDGGFGDETETALKKWQSNRRIPANGAVGPGTWAMLAAPVFRTTLKLGSKSEAVKQVKRALNKFGNSLDTNNPGFGPVTEKVVKAWQAHRRQRVDGVVDMVTWYWVHAPDGTTVPDLHPRA